MKQQQILDLGRKIQPRIRRCLLFLEGPGHGLQVVAEAQALLHDRPDLVWAEGIDPFAELQASGPDPGQHLLLEFSERSIQIMLADLEALGAIGQLGQRGGGGSALETCSDGKRWR